MTTPTGPLRATDLYLKLDRPEVSVEEFTDAVQELLALVREVSKEITGRADGIRWVITRLQAGSAILEAEPDVATEWYSEAVIERVMLAAGRGMQALERNGARPEHFSDEALHHARKLANIVSATDVGTSHVRLGAVSLTPTRRLAATVDELIGGKLKSIGAVEGVLLTVSKRDGYRFFIEDRIRRRRVECVFQSDMLRSVLDAFEKRVIVRGVVWSRKDGDPQRIDVRSFEVMEADETLPRVNSVRGILRGVEYDSDY